MWSDNIRLYHVSMETWVSIVSIVEPCSWYVTPQFVCVREWINRRSAFKSPLLWDTFFSPRQAVDGEKGLKTQHLLSRRFPLSHLQALHGERAGIIGHTPSLRYPNVATVRTLFLPGAIGTENPFVTRSIGTDPNHREPKPRNPTRQPSNSSSSASRTAKEREREQVRRMSSKKGAPIRKPGMKQDESRSNLLSKIKFLEDELTK